MKKFNLLKTTQRWFPFHLFGQLVIAFTIIIFLMTGGLYFATRSILHGYALRDHDSPTVESYWAEHLADYYAQGNSWVGVESLIAGYPCGTGWMPWPQEPLIEYNVATSDGTIIAASQPDRIGETFWPAERDASTPIVVNGTPVGYVYIFQNAPFKFKMPPAVLWDILMTQRFTPGIIITIVLSLAAGVIVAHSISRPLADLTAATRAVTKGDLSVRVPVTQQGEARELALAFNTMADALNRADELRRNMTADTAHELRTPLSIIRAKLEGVIDGVYPATPEHLEPILTEVELLSHLVDDLRLLALAEAGQLQLDKRPTDIGDLLRDAQVNFSAQAADKAITLSLDLPATLPRVAGDWRRIAQVLSNLMTNALRHTPEGGQITLGATIIEKADPGKPSGTARKSWVEVTVSDTGIGIPPEDLPHIFERFWRSEKSRSRASGGSGLGLSIAKHLVELHGGTITAESTPGKGSTFRFILPVA